MSEVFENSPVPEINSEETNASFASENKSPIDTTIHVTIEGFGIQREFSLLPHTFILIGRTPKAGTPEEAVHFFPIDEMDISRKHAEIFWDGQTLYLKSLSDSGLEYAGETLFPPETRSILPEGTITLLAREKKRTFPIQYKVPELLAPIATPEDDDKTKVYIAPEDDDKTKVYQPSEDVTRFNLSAGVASSTEQPITLTLKVTTGNARGTEKTLTFERSGEEGRIYLGRSEETEFPISETWVSRIHASISRQNQNFLLRRETQYDHSVFIEGQSLLLKQEVPLKDSGAFIFRAGEQQLEIQYAMGNASSTSIARTNLKKEDVSITEKEVSKIKMTEFLIESPSAGTEPVKIDVYSHKLSYFLGTAPACDYRVTHQKEFVAPQHAEITFDTPSRSYFVRCVADRAIGMQLNDKSIYEQTPLQDGDRIRFGFDLKAPEVIFRTTAPSLIAKEEEGGEPAFYGVIELRWEDEEKTKEIRLHGVVRSSPSRTGVRVLLGNSTQAHFTMHRPGALEKHAQFALIQDEQGKLHFLLENLSRDDFEIEDGNASPHQLPKRNYTDLHYQSGRVKLSPNFPWLEYRVIPEKNLEAILTKLFSAVITSHKKLSDLIPQPLPGMSYRIGSNANLELVLPEIDEELAVLEVLPEEEKFTIRRLPETQTRIFLDGTEIQPGERKRFHFGENLAIGPVDISNDFRVLFPPKESRFLKHLLITLTGLLFVLLLAGGLYLFWDQNLLSTKKIVMENHRKNLVWIATTNREDKILSQGSGFVWKNQRSFYLFTSKRTVQPWKYEPHKASEERTLIRKDQEPLDLPLLISAWIYGDRIQKEGKILFQNAFTDHPLRKNSQGDLILLPLTEEQEQFQELTDGYRSLLSGNVTDLAILELKNFQRSLWKWDFASAEVGKSCFASLYPATLSEEFQPIVIEGKLQSAPKDLFILMPHQSQDLQHKKYASGAVVVDEQGGILGMLIETPAEIEGFYMLKASTIHNLVKEPK